MKAKLKENGRIIEVYPTAGYVDGEQLYQERFDSPVSYKESDLDFEDTIDWKQQRVEIAKAAMQGIIGSWMEANTDVPLEFSIRTLSFESVYIADSLIKQLKEE